MTIDDTLLEQLKERAAETGTSVSKLIEDSVRLAAAARRTGRRKSASFKLVTFGAGGRCTDLDVDRISSLVEREDVERYGRRR